MSSLATINGSITVLQLSRERKKEPRPSASSLRHYSGSFVDLSVESVEAAPSLSPTRRAIERDVEGKVEVGDYNTGRKRGKETRREDTYTYEAKETRSYFALFCFTIKCQ